MRSIKRTVLVVEDDEVYRLALVRHMEIAGFDVIAVGDSFEAFKVIDRVARIDGLLADVVMPTGCPHGISLGRIIRRQRPEVAVFLMTAYPELAALEQPLPGPLLLKTTGMGELVASLARAFGS
jgi:CheY-like chemotaxis protein